MKILVVGDSYISADAFRSGLKFANGSRHTLDFVTVHHDPEFEPTTASEHRLREFEGTPEQVSSALQDHDVLVVHGAPVTEDVLRASQQLALVACARGGPVNVDLKAARELGIPVTTTPGKNAQSVADLTIAFVLMLARGIRQAEDFLRSGNRVASTFDGARFLGLDLVGLTVGLIGFGRVGQEVCVRARAFGMEVITYDPFVSAHQIVEAGAEAVGLRELARRADVLSLHARQTVDNGRMIDDGLLSQCKPGAFFINTAREGLVDEEALVRALKGGVLAGVALDVFEPDGAVSEVLATKSDDLDRIVLTPHVGGATFQTIARGAEMVAAEIDRFASGRPLLYLL